CIQHPRPLVQRGARLVAHLSRRDRDECTGGRVFQSTHKEPERSQRRDPRRQGGPMNSDIAFDIVALALSLAKNQPGAAVADTLLQIIRKAVSAYQQHTGEPLNPSLIQTEET